MYLLYRCLIGIQEIEKWYLNVFAGQNLCSQILIPKGRSLLTVCYNRLLQKNYLICPFNTKFIMRQSFLLCQCPCSKKTKLLFQYFSCFQYTLNVSTSSLQNGFVQCISFPDHSGMLSDPLPKTILFLWIIGDYSFYSSLLFFVQTLYEL